MHPTRFYRSGRAEKAVASFIKRKNDTICTGEAKRAWCAIFLVQKAGANGLKICTKPEESAHFKPNAQYIVQSRR